MPRTAAVVVLLAGPLALAALGTTHPHELDATTADWWTRIHLVLLPLFVTLAVSIWVLLRGRRGVIAWTARVLAVLFVPLYTALDAINGIGAGTVMAASGAQSRQDVPAIASLFPIGNQLGMLGAWSLIAAAALALVVLTLASPRWVLFAPGGLGLLAGLVVFSRFHVYWPTGVAAMVAVAAGSMLVEASLWRRTPAVART